MQKMLSFLQTQNPFTPTTDNVLVNIATGVVASDQVNVDEALIVGRKIHDSITNKTFSQVSLKRKKQAVTFAVAKKALRIDSGVKLHISSSELSQRLLAVASCSQQPDPTIYSYELSTVAPALFTDDGLMRKSQNCQLTKFIVNMNAEIVISSEVDVSVTVIDGYAVMQQMVWPKVGTIGDSCNQYAHHVMNNYQKNINQKAYVVFDSYDVVTMKEPEQKRRCLKTVGPDVIVHRDLPIPPNKASFLSNKRNKQSYIKLLSKYLLERTIAVEHAGDEGDADVVIVRAACNFAESGKSVAVVSEDTDVFILLLHHIKQHVKMYMQSRSRTIDIGAAHQALGDDICSCLPFLHAMSGCDTTSSFFGFGKLKALKLLQKSKYLLQTVNIFGNLNAQQETIGKAGEEFIAAMYSSTYSGVSKLKKLDELRFLNMMSTKYDPLQRLPPTSRAAYYHSLRVHHQTSTWKELQTRLKKEDYGFHIDKYGDIKPIITDKQSAFSELLKDIRCSCTKSEPLCTSCSCCKTWLSCSMHCKCGGQCANPVRIFPDNIDDADC